MDKELHDIAMNWSHHSQIPGLERLFADFAYDLCEDREKYDICTPENIDINDVLYINAVSRAIRAKKNRLINELDEYLGALAGVKERLENNSSTSSVNSSKVNKEETITNEET